MKSKMITIFIFLIMIFSCLGFSVATKEVENNSIIKDCKCNKNLKDTDKNVQIVTDQWGTHYTGLKPSEDFTTEPDSKIYIQNNLPSHFDWRNAKLDENGYGVADGGKDYTTSVKDQGDCGSCWAFASVGAFESKIEIMKNSPNLNPDLSEQYLVSCLTGSCSKAASTREVYDFIFDNGVMKDSCFRYTSGDGSVPACREVCSKWYFIIDYQKTSYSGGIDYVKQSLIEEGPLYAGMAYEGSLFHWFGDVYIGDLLFGNSLNTASSINHAIVIVGYQDTSNCPHDGYWICKNSWGTNWGPNDNGYFKVAYDTAAIEKCIVTVEYSEEPDLECRGTLTGSGRPGNTINLGTLYIKNAGAPTSTLNWNIDELPEWGSNWRFLDSYGNNIITGHLKPEDGETKLDVFLDLPKDKDKSFSGEIKIINSEDDDDFEKITVSCKTPKFKFLEKTMIFNMFEKFFSKF